MSTVKTAILTVPGDGTSHVFGSLGRPDHGLQCHIVISWHTSFHNSGSPKQLYFDIRLYSLHSSCRPVRVGSKPVFVELVKMLLPEACSDMEAMRDLAEAVSKQADSACGWGNCLVCRQGGSEEITVRLPGPACGRAIQEHLAAPGAAADARLRLLLQCTPVRHACHMAQLLNRHGEQR